MIQPAEGFESVNPKPGFPRGATIAAMQTRVERDSMGDVEVPVDALWGAQTQRAMANFSISGETIGRELIEALAMVKAAAAEVNGQLGVISPEVAAAVVAAGNQVASGDHDAQFPIDIFQTGSGTSSNMNANEVIAHLASRELGFAVHPNDHVNASQSSNDVFPSAVHLATLNALEGALIPCLDHLAKSLRARQADLGAVVKAGRTHLVDATPVTLGQEVGGWATAVEIGIERIRSCFPRLGELALGGTAVGTGLNAPVGFASGVIELLASRTGHRLVEARDHFEAQGGRDSLVEVSGALRTVAVTSVKIANDLRWMASGPGAGLGEIRLPDLQPGSSIMPGKVNPVIPEVVVQVAAQVIGNDAAVAFAGTTGSFELNVAVPAMARNVLASVRLLAAALRSLADLCVAGMEADVGRCRHHAESSPALATALAPFIGYEVAAAVVKEAISGGRTIREVMIERQLMEIADIDRALDVEAMTRGGVLG